MSDKPRKPPGWYSLEAKAERARERQARRAEREAEKEAAQRRQTARQRRISTIQKHGKRLVEKARAEKSVVAAKIAADDAAHKEFAKQLRKELREKRLDDNPYLRRQHRKSSFVRMLDAEKIDGNQLRAAEEIDAAFTALTSGLWAKGMRTELAGITAPGPRTLSIPSSLSGVIDRYHVWANELSAVKRRGGWPLLEVTIDVVVDQRACSDIDAEKGWRSGTTDLIIQHSLMLYCEIAEWVPKGTTAELDKEKFGVKIRRQVA